MHKTGPKQPLPTVCWTFAGNPLGIRWESPSRWRVAVAARVVMVVSACRDAEEGVNVVALWRAEELKGLYRRVRQSFSAASFSLPPLVVISLLSFSSRAFSF